MIAELDLTPKTYCKTKQEPNAKKPHTRWDQQQQTMNEQKHFIWFRIIK